MTTPIEIPGSPPPELPEDTKSLGEAVGMDQGVDLSSREAVNKLNRLLRMDGVQTHTHRVIVCGLWVVAIAAAIMFVVIVGHKVGAFWWMSPEKVADLQSFLFSGVLGATITGFGKRMLPQEAGKP